MARPKKFVGTLSEADSEKLERIANSRTEELRRVQRAKIVLMSARGEKNSEIAESLGISVPTICKVVKKWTLFGVDAALEDLKRSGKPPSIDIAARTWVTQLACHLPQDYEEGPKSQLWTISSLAEYIRQHCEAEGHQALKGIQESTVWSILNKSDIKPHRVKYYLVKKDPDFKEKAKDVLLLYKRVTWILQMTKDYITEAQDASDLSGEVFISYDEKPGIQAVGNIAPDRRPTLKSGQGCVGRDYEYRRHGTVSLLAGIDLMSGEVTGIVRDTHTSAEFIEFLTEIDKKYDSGLKIHVILDNHSVHRSKEVLDWLAKRPGRFEFTFTPKHASWLNLVESFFSKLARQCLRHLRVKSKQELVNHIQEWIADVNRTPVVYRWQWKLEDIQGAFKDSPVPPS